MSSATPPSATSALRAAAVKATPSTPTPAHSSSTPPPPPPPQQQQSASTAVQQLLLLPSSRPGTGSERVVGLLRLYAKLLCRPLEVMIIDALLSEGGPFSFGGGPEGGATVMQLSQYLGVIPRLIQTTLKNGGGTFSNGGMIISSKQLPSFKLGGGDDDDSDDDDDDGPALSNGLDDDDDGGGANNSRTLRAMLTVRYYINFTRAVPMAYAHLCSVFMTILKRSSDAPIDVNNARDERRGGGGAPSIASSSSPSSSGGRFWHCFKCCEWLPQLSSQRQVKNVCHCGICGGHLVLGAAAEARRCFEALRGGGGGGGSTKTVAASNAPTAASAPSTSSASAATTATANNINNVASFTMAQKWLITLYRDPSLLQQLSAFEFLCSSRLVCTALVGTSLSPTDWATEEESKALQFHAAAGGLVSAVTANIFRLAHATASSSSSGGGGANKNGHNIQLLLCEEKDGKAAESNALKVAKRHTLPPWMAPPGPKEGGEGDQQDGEKESNADDKEVMNGILGGKRARSSDALTSDSFDDDFFHHASPSGDHLHAQRKASTSEIVSAIARSALSEKFTIVDL